MALYKIDVVPVQVHGQYEEGLCERTAPGKLFRVGFGDPAPSNEIAREVDTRLAEIKASGVCGPLALVNGPMAVVIGLQVGHILSHLFGSVGVFDPKLGGYVVALSHGGPYAVGDVIPAAEVREE